MTRVRVGVLFGGQSTEHHISCASAASVLSRLDRDRFEPVPVLIAEDGTWHCDPRMAHSRDVDAGTLKSIIGEASDGRSRAETMAAAVAVLGTVDVVFPVLHGVLGEDGTIQGLLELLGVPYVGCGVPAGAIGLHKEATKKILRSEGIMVAGGVVLQCPHDTLTEAERDHLGLPVFVKPNSGGSSIGVARVTDWADLNPALAEAFQSDTKVLVEPAVPGREIGISVLEFPDGRIMTAPLVESWRDVSRFDFLNHAAKYEDSSTKLLIPADVDRETEAVLADTAVRAFRSLECSGLARVDFFVHADSGSASVVLNEVNTFPGFTFESQFPAAWASAGLSYKELLGVLIDTALVRRSKGVTLSPVRNGLV